MSTDTKNKKGITFVTNDAVSKEAVRKLDGLMEKKKERLNKLVEDYNAGKFSMQ